MSASTSSHPIATRRRGARGRWAAAAIPLLAGLAAAGTAQAVPPPTVGVTVTVTSTASSGAGSLRNAINATNAYVCTSSPPCARRIEFDIPGSGPHVITPLTALPQITRPVTIDGYTQPGAREATATQVANPLIVIDGSNVDVGLDVESSDNVIRGLVIHDVPGRPVPSPGIEAAIYVGNGARNAIEGNYLGTGANGFQAPGNYRGVFLVGEVTDTTIGGTDPADRNVVSGNAIGVEIDAGSGNVVEGNRIGVTATGAAALNSTSSYWTSGFRGVVLDSPGSVVRDNQIAAQVDGITVDDGESVIQGNLIGTDASGSTAIPNDVGVTITGGDHTIIGGSGAGQGNLISGNEDSAIQIEDVDPRQRLGTIIEGNRIGTDAAGTAAVPNEALILGEAAIDVFSGKAMIGGGSAAGANVISGNAAAGIMIFNEGAGSVVTGNMIGTDPSGALDLGNGGSGADLSAASDVRVGGTNPGDGNVIAHNGGDGVTVTAGAGTAGTDDPILGNSIHDNGDLGIDLGDDGVTADDPAPDGDAGANDLQNFPVITGVTTSGGRTTVDWTLDSRPSSTFRIEFFAGTCDPTGNGEGETYLGSTTAFTDASGHAAGSTSVTAPASGQVVTATATSGLLTFPSTTGIPTPVFVARSTSELSACA